MAEHGSGVSWALEEPSWTGPCRAAALWLSNVSGTFFGQDSLCPWGHLGCAFSHPLQGQHSSSQCHTLLPTATLSGAQPRWPTAEERGGRAHSGQDAAGGGAQLGSPS